MSRGSTSNAAVAGAAATVVVAAATGLATNVLTDRPSWGAAAGLVALVLTGVVLADLALELIEQARRQPHPGPS